MLSEQYFLLLRDYANSPFRVHLAIKNRLSLAQRLDEDDLCRPFNGCESWVRYVEVNGNGAGEDGLIKGIWLAVAETAAPERIEEIMCCGL